MLPPVFVFNLVSFLTPRHLHNAAKAFFFQLNLTIYPLAILILDAVIYKFDSLKISTRPPTGGSLVGGIDKKDTS